MKTPLAQRLRKHSLAIISVVYFCGLFFAASAQAADIYFSDAPAVLASNKPFYVDILLDAKGERLNAVQGAIYFPSDLMEVVDIYNGKSIVTNWVVAPHVDGSSIQFAGIMAGGFLETVDPMSDAPLPGTLFRVVFRSLKEGSGIVAFENAHAFLDDGLGTEAKLAEKIFPLTLQEGGTAMGDIFVDTIGPDPFIPVIARNDDLFDGQYFLAFETKDRGTGVAYYSVKEGNNPWIRAESPYLLTDQTLRHRIKVIAYDNAGNSTQAVVGERYTPYYLTGLILLCFVLLLIHFIKKRRRARINTSQ